MQAAHETPAQSIAYERRTVFTKSLDTYGQRCSDATLPRALSIREQEAAG
jgi:hypothetical protein